MELRRRKTHEYQCLSLDQPILSRNERFDDRVTTLGDLIPDSCCIEDDTIRNITLKSVFETLPDFYKEIVTMRLAGKGQVEISKATGLSQSYISRILKDIRDMIEGRPYKKRRARRRICSRKQRIIDKG